MAVDDATFRELMGAFSSGVAVVTAAAANGDPLGLTTRSLLSVTADPPLLLVSIDRTSRTLSAIRDSGTFVVNFLAAGREALSMRFASKADDKFDGVRWTPSRIAKGAPVLAHDAVAYVECRVTQEVEAGDHWLIVALVEGGRFIGGRPLLYYRRSYAEWPGPD